MGILHNFEVAKLAIKASSIKPGTDLKPIKQLADKVYDRLNQLSDIEQITKNLNSLMVLAVAYQNLGEFKKAAEIGNTVYHNNGLVKLASPAVVSILHTGAFSTVIHSYQDEANRHYLLDQAINMLNIANSAVVTLNGSDRRVAGVLGTLAFAHHAKGTHIFDKDWLRSRHLADAEYFLIQAEKHYQNQIFKEDPKTWPGNADAILDGKWETFLADIEIKARRKQASGLRM